MIETLEELKDKIRTKQWRVYDKKPTPNESDLYDDYFILMDNNERSAWQLPKNCLDKIMKEIKKEENGPHTS